MLPTEPQPEHLVPGAAQGDGMSCKQRQTYLMFLFISCPVKVDVSIEDLIYTRMYGRLLFVELDGRQSRMFKDKLLSRTLRGAGDESRKRIFTFCTLKNYNEGDRIKKDWEGGARIEHQLSNAYILVAKLEEMRSFGRSRCGWKDTINCKLKTG
jgi:hypothetical protein